MKVKDTVYEYTIKFDFLKDRVVQERCEYQIIGINDERMCINDRGFSSIKLKKSYRGDKDELFNDVVVFDSHYEGYWDYIQASLYSATTSEKIAYKRMKRALEKFIQKKHGRYCNAIAFLDKIEL
jgi:hypothetical protein